MKLVYVAGPYTHPDPVTNTRHAVQEGLLIYATTGAGVIIPHLSLLAHAMFPQPLEFWYEFDLAQVLHCDAVYRILGASTGADKEVEFAQQHDIPVFYSMAKLTDWLGT